MIGLAVLFVQILTENSANQAVRQAVADAEPQCFAYAPSASSMPERSSQAPIPRKTFSRLSQPGLRTKQVFQPNSAYGGHQPMADVASGITPR